MNEATLNVQLQALRLSQMKANWRELEQCAIAAGWRVAAGLAAR